MEFVRYLGNSRAEDCLLVALVSCVVRRETGN